MARVTIEDCGPYAENRFALSILAVRRTKQLLSGATCTVPSGRDKPTVTALREIAAGNVKFEQDLRNVLGHHAPIPGGPAAAAATPSAPTLDTVADALRRQPFVPIGR
jgi:DNA-directed RNA polymerase subunit omega